MDEYELLMILVSTPSPRGICGEFCTSVSVLEALRERLLLVQLTKSIERPFPVFTPVEK